MSRRTISISVPAEIEEKLKRAAEQAGKPLEEWIVQTVTEKATSDIEEDEGYRAAMRLIQEYEAEHGPIPEEIWREAREEAESLVAGENGAHQDAVPSAGVVNR